jgi:hypothetical protein
MGLSPIVMSIDMPIVIIIVCLLLAAGRNLSSRRGSDPGLSNSNLAAGAAAVCLAMTVPAATGCIIEDERFPHIPPIKILTIKALFMLSFGKIRFHPNRDSVDRDCPSLNYRIQSIQKRSNKLPTPNSQLITHTTQDSFSEIGIVKNGVTEIGMAEIGMTEISTSQICLR